MSAHLSLFRLERALNFLGTLTGDDSGQDVVEYGLMIACIVLVILVGTAAFGTQVKPWFEQLTTRVTTVGT